jgi:hypothetical protein
MMSTADKAANRHRPYQPRPKPDVFLSIPNRSTRDGRRLRELHADLVKHVGGAPNAVQAVLIGRITMLQWQAIQLDRTAATATGEQAISIADRADKLANTIGRALARLGLQGAAAPKVVGWQMPVLPPIGADQDAA